MDLFLVVLNVFALIVGICAMALTIYNFFRMTQEVRSKAHWWVNLIPYIAFALPGSLTPAGEAHRSKGGRWLAICGVSIAIAVTAQYLGAE